MFDAERRYREVEVVEMRFFDPDDDLREEFAYGVVDRRPDVKGVPGGDVRWGDFDEEIAEALFFPMVDSSGFEKGLSDIVGSPSVAEQRRRVQELFRRGFGGRFDELDAAEHVAERAVSAAWRIGYGRDCRHV